MRGLYCITPDHLVDPEALYQACRAVIRGGAQLIQFRQKTPGVDRHLLASVVIEATQGTHTRVLINDDADLAHQLGAHGCHLGQTDGDLADARALLGPQAIIGRTCHDRVDLAAEAIRSGASYCAFGRLFPSNTKPEAGALAMEQLASLVASCTVPTVAIGGITPTNAHYALRAGIDMLAVSDAVFNAPDPEATANAFARQF